MAVELPDLPRSLTIRPKGRIRRIASLIGLKQRCRDTTHPGNLSAAFSSSLSGLDAEQSFLSMDRLRIFEEFEKKLGGVYVYDGKVFLVKRRKSANQLDLNALYENAILLATKFVDAG